METYREIFRRYIAAYETRTGEKGAAFLHPSHLYPPPGGAQAMSRAERIEDERFFFSAFS